MNTTESPTVWDSSILPALQLFLADDNPNPLQEALTKLYYGTEVLVLGMYDNALCLSAAVLPMHKRLLIGRDSSYSGTLSFQTSDWAEDKTNVETRPYTAEALLGYMLQLSTKHPI